jgi:hypothetical protein
MLHERLTFGGMRIAQGLWQKHLDGLPNQVGPQVAEERLALRVHENDAAIGAHDEKPVRRCLDQRAEEGIVELRLRALWASPRPQNVHRHSNQNSINRAEAHASLAPGPPARQSRAAVRHAALLADIEREFPSFAICYKRDSSLQRAIHTALAVLTLGGQRGYLTRYHTVLFGKLWVPDSWDQMGDDERYILLRHERVHLRQRARMGDVAMAFVYLVPVFPLFLAYGRARIEWEAYVETIRATAEIKGIEAASALGPEIVRRFIGPDYGWMWPFPNVVRGWFAETIENLRSERAA